MPKPRSQQTLCTSAPMREYRVEEWQCWQPRNRRLVSHGGTKSSSEPHFVLVLSASFFLFFNTDTYTTKLINFGKLSQCLGDNWQCKWQQALACKVFISSALLYSLLSRRLNTVHCTVHSAEESMTWNHEKLLRTAAAGARDLGAACYQVFF